MQLNMAAYMPESNSDAPFLKKKFTSWLQNMRDVASMLSKAFCNLNGNPMNFSIKFTVGIKEVADDLFALI